MKIDSETRGGHLADIPKPWKRLYDDKRRRRIVKLQVMKFYGIGHHWYPSLTEDDNPILNVKEKTWQCAWDDEDCKGKYFSARFVTKNAVKAWIKRTLKKEFPNHKLVDVSYEEIKWYYKDGD